MPRASFTYDTDGAQGVASRLKVFDMLATQRMPLVSYHFPWPGLGYIGRQGDVYKFYDIYTATGALVVVTGLQLIYSWVRYRKVEKMQLFTFILVGFFGGLTVFFHDDTFIKWKVTIINVLFALGLLAAALALPMDRRNVTRHARARSAEIRVRTVRDRITVAIDDLAKLTDEP